MLGRVDAEPKGGLGRELNSKNPTNDYSEYYIVISGSRLTYPTQPTLPMVLPCHVALPFVDFLGAS
mgnify:CR=1 FL=1